MILVFIVTAVLLLVTVFIKGGRCVEVMLLTPFFIGSIVVPVLGVEFFEVKDGDVFLVSCLFFEWLTLIILLGMFRVGSLGELIGASLPSRGHYVRGFWLLILFIALVLVSYIAKEFSILISQSDVSSYFVSRRISAHAGEGVDSTNPIAYRAINFSMAMIIFSFAAKGCGYFNVTKCQFRVVLLFLFLFGGVASLMEGNRSTIIVTVISVFVYLFVSKAFSLLKMSVLFIFFILFFVFAQQIFRLDGDISPAGILVGFQWFVLYAFGSVASVSNFMGEGIDLYWKSYDVLVYKFGLDSFFAKDFFIIKSVDVGVMRTNVYGGYAVLYDYMGYFLFVFLFFKNVVFCSVCLSSRYSVFLRGVLLVLMASYPLTIYHEYFITCLYYGFNIFLVWLFSYILAVLYKYVSALVALSCASSR